MNLRIHEEQVSVNIRINRLKIDWFGMWKVQLRLVANHWGTPPRNSIWVWSLNIMKRISKNLHFNYFFFRNNSRRNIWRFSPKTKICMQIKKRRSGILLYVYWNFEVVNFFWFLYDFFTQYLIYGRSRVIQSMILVLKISDICRNDEARRINGTRKNRCIYEVFYDMYYNVNDKRRKYVLMWDRIIWSPYMDHRWNKWGDQYSR